MQRENPKPGKSPSPMSEIVTKETEQNENVT